MCATEAGEGYGAFEFQEGVRGYVEGGVGGEGSGPGALDVICCAAEGDGIGEGGEVVGEEGVHIDGAGLSVGLRSWAGLAIAC